MSETVSHDGGGATNQMSGEGHDGNAITAETSAMYYLTKARTEMASYLGHHIATARISECLQPLTDLIERLQSQEVGRDALTNRLRHLVNQLRDKLHGSPLKEEAVGDILRPLDEFIKDTQELAELDHVHTELENKIIKPIERAQAKSTNLSWYFGIVGLIAAIVSITGLLLSWRSQGDQRELVTKQEVLVQEMQASAKEGEAKLELLADAVHDLGDKVKEQSSPGVIGPIASLESVDPALLLGGNPRRALEIAVATHNSELAYTAAKRIIDGSYGAKEEVEAIALAGLIGGAGTIDLIIEVWNRHKSDMTPQEASLLAGVTVQYYDRRDREQEGEALVMEMAQHVDNHPDSSPEDKAFMWNQLGKLTSEYDPERAKGYTLNAIERNPSEPSYHYNLSIIYESVGQVDEAIVSAERALAQQDDDKDGDHYSQAIDVYLKRLEGSGGDSGIQRTRTETRLRELLQELRQIDQNLWTLKLVTEERLRDFSSE